MDPERARERLRQRLATLLERVGRIESDLRSPGSPDFEDRASELENEEVLERLDASERREIGEIRAALERVDRGTYGRCGQCGKAIDGRRLEAVPYTSLCVACAE